MLLPDTGPTSQSPAMERFGGSVKSNAICRRGGFDPFRESLKWFRTILGVHGPEGGGGGGGGVARPVYRFSTRIVKTEI